MKRHLLWSSVLLAMSLAPPAHAEYRAITLPGIAIDIPTFWKVEVTPDFLWARYNDMNVWLRTVNLSNAESDLGPVEKHARNNLVGYKNLRLYFVRKVVNGLPVSEAAGPAFFRDVPVSLSGLMFRGQKRPTRTSAQWVELFAQVNDAEYARHGSTIKQILASVLPLEFELAAGKQSCPQGFSRYVQPCPAGAMCKTTQPLCRFSK